jgi:hypothetical protein
MNLFQPFGSIFDAQGKENVQKRDLFLSRGDLISNSILLVSIINSATCPP